MERVMAFDKNFAINVMYPAANDAYLIMNMPQPPLQFAPGYMLAGPIMADPGRAAHAMAQASPDQQRIANAMVAESSIFGLVAWNAVDRTALIAIRGTQTIWDWIADFDAAPVPWSSNPDCGLVHMGFQLVYEHICVSVRELLQGKCPGMQRLLVTGHSLGGALAVLCAFDLFQNLQLGFAPELYTFAGPRVGDPGFANRFNRAIPACNRIVNFMDVVPQVPLPPLYEHVGQETLVHGGFRPLDVTYAHHLTTYLNGLQKLAAPPAAIHIPEEIVVTQDLSALSVAK
jgi:hypothetical protein